MEGDHHQHLEGGTRQFADFSQRGLQLVIEIGGRSENPATGLMDEHDTALRAVRLKRRKDVVGAEVSGEKGREQPPRRRSWTGKDKSLGEPQESGRNSRFSHGVNMPESQS